MPKKSSSGRSRPTGAQSRPTTRRAPAPERGGTATLVRAPGAAETGASAENIVLETTEVTREPAPITATVTEGATVPPTAQPTVTPVESKPAPKPAPKVPAKSAAPAAATPAPARPAPSSSREQAVRLARARATQQARVATHVAPENYAYVLGDLKLVLGLAITAFVILIALTFVLPH